MLEYNLNQIRKGKDAAQKILEDRTPMLSSAGMLGAVLSFVSGSLILGEVEQDKAFILDKSKHWIERLIDTKGLLFDSGRTKKSHYGQSQILLFVFLLDPPKEDWDFLVSKSQIQKPAFDRFLDLFLQRVSGSGALSEKPFINPTEALITAMESEEQKIVTKQVIKYLDGYQSRLLSTLKIGDIHRNPETKFSGYFSWEVAALTKAFGWDDRDWKEHQYYPGGLQSILKF